jgi:WD40 repeat protein
VRLCDVDTGEEVRRFPRHTGFVFCVAFSPDGRWVLSGSYDGTLRSWQRPS